MSDSPHESDPPEVLLVAKAAGDLVAIYHQEGRSNAALIQATDALGRALVRLKKHLRDAGP